MVRREIKNFELITEEGRYTCSVPFSVKSVLEANGASFDCLKYGVKIQCEIYVDDVALAMKNFYLRLRGMSHPARVYLGDRLLGECDGRASVCNLNAEGFLEKGNNLLSIQLDGSDTARLVHAGLSNPVEILRFSGAIIDSVMLTQTHGEGSVDLGISLSLIGNASSVRAVATLVSSTGQIYYAGLTGGRGTISVKDPLYWWPRGLGVQNLYRLTVNLYGETDIEDSSEMRIGLRRVSHPISHEDESVMIGDLKILPMGATYIADSSPDPAYLDSRAEAAVTSAAMADFNCLLLPLDAQRPTDKFYEMCDLHGIMVIEEISDLSDGMLSALSARASHPSLVAIDLIGSFDEEDSLRLSSAMPNLIVRNHVSKPVYASAPSLPSMKTLRTVITEDERNLFSHTVESIAESGAIREMLLSVADRYPYPGDFSSFAYASALASAHKVGEIIRDSRLAGGRCGAAVFSRLSDEGLTISSSAIDYRGRWKPLQYYASRLFAPSRLYATAGEGVVTFYAVNHRRNFLSAMLEYRILDSRNKELLVGSREVELSAMSADKLYSVDFSDVVEGHEREYYLEYTLKEGTTILSRDVLLFVPEKHFKFKKPNIKAIITGEGKSFSITLATDCFTKDLEIGFDGIDVVLSDNYIDLTSDAPIRIDFTVQGGLETTYRLKDALMLRSVADL